MYISICEVLNKRLKVKVAEAHGHTVGLHWPTSVVNPLEERIDALNGKRAGKMTEALIGCMKSPYLREAVLDVLPPHRAPRRGPRRRS